jgi:hypothetical protein
LTFGVAGGEELFNNRVRVKGDFFKSIKAIFEIRVFGGTIRTLRGSLPVGFPTRGHLSESCYHMICTCENPNARPQILRNNVRSYQHGTITLYNIYVIISNFKHAIDTSECCASCKCRGPCVL